MRLLKLLALLLFVPSLAAAQMVNASSNTGRFGPVVSGVDQNGNPGRWVVNGTVLVDPATGLPYGAGVASQQVQGNSAAAAADVGNPVKVGGVYNTTTPTYATGQRSDLQTGIRGSLKVELIANDQNATIGVPNNADAQAVNAQNSALKIYNSAFNGTSLDRVRSIQGADGTGLGVQAVAYAPHASATGAIAPVVSSAVESSRIFKASAGNLYRVSITTGGSAGYLMMFNAITAPADGAVTPAVCRVVAANATLPISMADMPSRFSTGITAVFSTTGCFTKTASATAFFEGYVQ